MAEINSALFIQGGSHGAENYRRLLGLLFGDRQGVHLQDDALSVTAQDTPNMSVKVSSGRGLISGDEGAYQGLYFVDNQGSLTLTIAASDGSNTRHDLVVARVYDAAYGVSVTNEWALEVITGTPAASPSDPSVPDNALVLARVTVGAGVSTITNGNITDYRRSYDTSQQGALSVYGASTIGTTSERPDSPYEGQLFYDTSLQIQMVYDRTWGWTGTAPIKVAHATQASNAPGNSAVWTKVIDKESDWTAPFSGVLHTSVTGMMGFNSSAGTFRMTAYQNDGSTQPPAGVTTSSCYAQASEWGSVSCDWAQSFTTGNLMGFNIWQSDTVNSGTTHHRIRYTAMYWPRPLWDAFA